MTLLEIIIALAVLALAVGVMVPSLANMGRTDLRRATRVLALKLRTVAADAALTGQTYRVHLPVGQGSLKVEATEEVLRLDPKDGQAVGHSALLEQFSPQGFELAQKADTDALSALGNSPLAGALRIGQSGQAAARHPFINKGSIELGQGIRVLDVWTSGMEGVATEGEVYLHFFAAGYTQEALVHLQDADGRVYTVKLAGLTCRSETFDHYVDVPK